MVSINQQMRYIEQSERENLICSPQFNTTRNLVVLTEAVGISCTDSVEDR